MSWRDRPLEDGEGEKGNDWEIIEAMETYGGSFVKALADCFRKADISNRAKLINTFEDYWKEYRKTVLIQKRIKSSIENLTIEGKKVSKNVKKLVIENYLKEQNK